MSARDQISSTIRAARTRGRPALVAYLTAGFPTKEKFAASLRAASAVADVIEVGVPFSDPMADGPTVQRSSRTALEQGVSLKWILEFLAAEQRKTDVPVLLMTYLNPLLAFGLKKLAKASAAAQVSGFIVPDLPLEECKDLRDALDSEGLALVQLVSPVTPTERLAKLCEASQGFVYAVTMTGTTGKSVATPAEVLEYFDRVRSVSPLPVCAGFGIRDREQVKLLDHHVDGVVVGSALVEAIEKGEDVERFLRSLLA